MDMLASNLILATALVIGVGIVLLIVKEKAGPLPPGPKGLPLVGSVTSLPTAGVQEWKHWLKHKDLYGWPISSVTALGTTIIVLHSPELAFELFEKKSSIYSSRARFVFGGEMVGWEDSVVLRPYDKQFRAHRKHVHSMIGTQLNAMPFLPLQETEVHRFLFRVLQEPEKLLAHIRTEAGAMILKMIYGYTIEPHRPDPLVQLADTALEQFSQSMVPGAWLVDIIPALRYIPVWMPGAGFKKTAKEWRTVLMETVGKPFQFTRQQMAKGDYEKSYVAKFGLDLSLEDDHIVKWTALTLYAGGADTTVNAVTSFFLAMTLYPEVQYKAREEIDRVIGSGRLPTFDDRDRLPYVNAVVTEAWRWHTVLPMGMPHVASADSVINGYYIPKGAIVMANVWWFTHDPAVYPNPSTFDPSRFLGASPCPNPRDHIFGYGRRICVGRFFANASVWLTIAQSLAVFNISKGLDENGVEIEPTVHFTPGLISRPEPFKATIKPRSSQHEALIRQVETLHPWEKSNADELGNIVI
ncbi:cytochrome P450 oxidoreductase OrdA-like protein [Xylariaceae sp. AK1471]|nr:cytochrome P450 oxidoreductase OrdA-like protein [Xylariaceae sp. AK1471]